MWIDDRIQSRKIGPPHHPPHHFHVAFPFVVALLDKKPLSAGDDISQRKILLLGITQAAGQEYRKGRGDRPVDD
ncbi:hypothetical protein [Agrobacterium tumefaciens]|uniref:hypothetical protein n=1 Tax=Agrobacterium tumefaciens TaxID=358 RepID=UPI000552DDD2|nr:hypothetical protein [Agrobacterium tumefaciens]